MEINFYWFAIKEILFKIKQAVFLSGLAPVNQQGSHSGVVREFLFSIVAVRGKNLSRSAFSAESGNSQFRNILSQLSCSQRFVFSNKSQKFHQAGCLQVFLENQRKLTIDPERVSGSLSLKTSSALSS